MCWLLNFITKYTGITFFHENKPKEFSTKKFIDLISVNTILPFKFLYAKNIGKGIEEELVKIISEIAAEDNSIITNFNKKKIASSSAKDSQALLQLYNNYCTKNKCLQCAVGVSLLKGNT